MSVVDDKPNQAPLSAADMVECGVCGRLFQTAQGLKTHTTRTHSEKPPVDQGRVFEPAGKPRDPNELARAIDEKIASEQGILDMIEGVEYEQARDAFMPVLAVEAAKRLADGDHRLAGVYFILYLDATL